jgi:flagellar hook-associated protein 2
MPITDTVSNLTPELQRVYQDAMKAEKKALQPITDRKTDVTKKIELLNDVMGKVEEVKKLMPGLSTPNGFRELTFLSGDDKIVTGTVNKDVAEPGSHSFEVLQLANKATALTNLFEDKNETQVGTGYLAFTNDKGEQKEIFIDDNNSTLEGVASSINKARAGVKASVIQDTVFDEEGEEPIHGFRLMLTSEKTGLGNNPEYPEFYLVDGDEELFIESENLASNSVLKYEGHKAEFPSNQVNDLIKGVTLDLKATTEPGKSVTVNIEEDIPKVKTKVKDFVDKINQVFSFIQTSGFKAKRNY